MPDRTAIKILMESPFYWRLPVAERLVLVKEFVKIHYCGRPGKEAS